MSAEYPAASWVPIPGFGYDPGGSHGREGHAVRWVIVHKTASPNATAQDIANYFAGDNQNGTHFVIGRDGAVIQMVLLADAAYGNAPLNPASHDAFWDVLGGLNPNFVTVSIEHCTTTSDNSDQLTPVQQDASFKLIAWLCKTLDIPARAADESGGVTGHYSLDGINRARCPGTYPWSELFASLQPSKQPVKETHSGMIMQHPTDAGRLDLVYLGHDGSVCHAHNASNGMAGLFTGLSAADFGKPTQEPLVYVEATFNNSGESIAVVAVGVSGQVYGRSFNTGDESPQNDWTPIARVFSTFPMAPVAPAPAAEPLAEKIAAAVLNATDALTAGLK